MNRFYTKILCLILLFFFASLPEGFSESSVSYGKAAENRIFAQRVVNAIKASEPDVIWAGIHAAPPESGDYRIVASTMDLIGKKSDDNDIDVAVDGRTHLTPNARLNKIGIMMPLKDAQGNIIGALGMALKYVEGQDQAALFTKATLIRDHIAKRIESRVALFQSESGP